MYIHNNVEYYQLVLLVKYHAQVLEMLQVAKVIRLQSEA